MWYLVTSGGSGPGEELNFVNGDLSGTYAIPRVIHVTEANKDLTYVGDTLTSVNDVYGTKTYNYDINGNLSSITSTGKYQSKILHYSSGILTSIEVI